MRNKTALIKIGGKILEDYDSLNSTISQLTQLYKEGLIKKIILIPGGGSVANFIRKVYTELKFREELAHWMGIVSMNYNGIELSKKFPKLKVIENFIELEKLGKIFCIFLPFKFLKENDKLPHSWDVTSDSITLFLAKELKLIECFLIKDIEGILDKKNQVIKEISPNDFRKLKESGSLAEFDKIENKLKNQTRPVDPYLMTLIEQYKIACVILSGTPNNQRILEFFDESKSSQEKIFTIIK
ncbi:MAG: amino acid kinase family protein [Promethearchaeota archaeon]|jgi:aspartokinase-like uncharacterized kinase